MPANPQASTTAERATLHALIDAKHLSLASGQSTTIQPLDTACGATSSASRQWTADNTGFFSVIHWYKYPDCTQVFLDYAELNVGFIWINEQWVWDSDAYNTDVWPVAGSVALQPYSSYHYCQNKTEPTNHWYRQWLDEYVSPYGNTTIRDAYITVCN